jgi:hydrophobe/amphiphile efflux-1 (HAE1) family protein
MSSLSSTSINRPVLAIVMNLAIILFGLIGFRNLGVREFPSIDPPVITVRTNYAGANSDIIESQITEPLEKAINGIAGIKSISSSSNQGSSVITVEFDLEVDMEAAANDVRDKVAQAVRALPPDLDGLPIVNKSDANSDPIISMTLQSNTRSHLEVSDYAENVVMERLQTIPGVSTIQIWGQKKYSMRIWMNPERLSSYGLTPLDVKRALDRENVELPAGKISGAMNELSLKTDGRLKTEEEFSQLIVAQSGDNVVRLGDVAKVELGPENEETVLKESGIPMIGMAIIPQPGANYIDISDEFYRRFEILKKNLPEDFKVDIALDNTRFIKMSVNEVGETLVIAVVLVVLIIFLFFRNWIISFRPLIDIPVSLIGAFFIMYLMGYSINVLTLLAIVLATGLVVDDGIVVTENIFKKIEDGMEPIEAAKKGSAEIYFAVISTSVTLAVVFLPVIFMKGFVGRLFQEFGVVLAGAVLISSFVALTLTPMLNSRLVRKNQKRSRFYESTEKYFVAMNNRYEESLARFLNRKWMAFVMVAFCGFLIYWSNANLKEELAPIEDRRWMRAVVTAPEGATFEYTDAFMNKMSKLVEDSIPEKKICITVTAPSFAGSGAANTGFMRVVLSEPWERNRSQSDIAQYLTRQLKNMPEARAFVIEQQTISTGGFGGLPVQYVIQAPNFDELKKVVPRFMEKAQAENTFSNVDVNLKFNKPEINLSIDREKAQNLGVSLIDIAQTLQLAFSPLRMAYFNLNSKQYQVIGQFDREYRSKPLDLSSIYIRNNRNELIQLDNLVQLDEVSNPPQLYHYNRYMSATISAGLAPGRTIGEGITAMNNIADETLDERFSTALTGPSRDFAESSSSLLFAFLLALVLVYLILAAQFESFRDPLVIMFTVPLALAGALAALWYFNQTLNIFSQIGIIMLIGLVTKNGILIVEFANQLQERGIERAQAIVEASVLRLRPILMTSLATALGALPIAISIGSASQSRVGMGIVIVGGIMFSLLLTLYVIPAMYLYISKPHKAIPHD